MADFDGRVVAYQDGDQLRLGCVLEVVKERLLLLDEQGNRTRIQSRRRLWEHPERVSGADQWPQVCEAVGEQIDSLAAEVDLELLWETVGESDQEFDATELTELYFSEANPASASALWRCLAAEGQCFRRKGRAWVRRSGAQRRELERQRVQQAEKARIRKVTEAWLRDALRSKARPPAPDAVAPLVERVEHWLYRRSDETETGRTLTAASPDLEPNEAACRVLLAAGRLGPDDDRYLALSGVAPIFPPEVEAAAGRLSPGPATDRVQPADFSLDDPETQEIDDALSVARDGDGFRVAVDIADVAGWVAPGDPLDVEASRRATSVYLPTVRACMLPERVSCDLASLVAGEARPAVRHEAVLSPAGDLRSFTLRRVWVSVGERLSYDRADQALGYAPADETATDAAESLSEEVGLKLRWLAELAARLREQRKSWGALTFERPEWSVKCLDGEVVVREIDRKSPSRNLVAEFMILANSLAAKLARDQHVPLIFRTQDPPGEPMPAMEEYDPVVFDRVRKTLRPARLSLHPGNHAGLGVSPYTQVTSPLRRYADLVMQRQLCAHLAGDELPYSQEALFEVLGRAEEISRQVARTEAAAVRHYLLTYLKETKAETPHAAVVLAGAKGGYRVELTKWGLSAFLRTSQPCRTGASIEVRVDRVSPEAGRLTVKL